MRTESSSSNARIKKKKRSSERSKRHDKGADDGEWKQFTSPDGHPYFYNAVTKESRWELPAESIRSKHRQSKGGSKHVVVSLQEEEDEPLEQAIGSKKDKKKRPESVEVGKQAKSKNATFQKLQASLEGRFSAMNGPMIGIGRPPPMLNIRRGDEEHFAGGDIESETKTQSPEEQYEAETAGMTAAERLRFLRKKRQENMMTKRESVSGDDFMAEVANNMKKKEATRKPQEKSVVLSWKKQEDAEEERKRQQMQAETEAKEQEEARKEHEQQAAIEREQRREREHAEQLALEQRREQERKQRQEEESRQGQEKEEKQKKRGKEAALDNELYERSSENEISNTSKTDVAEPDSQGQINSDALPDNSSDVSSPERVKHRRQSRSGESKHGASVLSVEENDVNQMANTGSEKSKHTVVVEDGADPVLDEKQRAREERRARKLREKELAVASVTPESSRRISSSANGHTGKEESSIRSTSSSVTEEEERAREKQLRREKRRMAKVEAALAAQNLGNSGNQGDAHHKRDRGGTPGDPENQSSSTSGLSHDGVSMSGQPHLGQAQFSGGMYAQYQYGMMMPPPPPPPTPYGYYYAYMQPPPMMSMYPPGMGGVPPGYQLMPPTPPPSLDGMGVPSAMVPYGADSTPFGAMYGQQFAPELSRCECCKSIGVGLVEKNGVCAHCNRLRLAFIVDSAQMRQRCSVCDGWGFQLLQANGMCEHCTRQTARKSQRKLVTKAQRRSSLAAPFTASSASSRRNSTGNPKNEGLDDIDWDKSSSGDSDWDD